MLRVVQTAEAFRYPAGKVWGPYAEEVDARDRLALIRRHGGDGVIESGEFGMPCAVTRDPSNSPSNFPVGV